MDSCDSDFSINIGGIGDYIVSCGLGVSVSVSIVGSSFDSAQILGKDGIGLSLTRTTQKSEKKNIGPISSSLIGCSFVNMSSIGSSRLSHLPHLNQKMLGCVVSLTSSHLSGSTIRDMNNGGSLLSSNSSFSSLLSSPHDNTDSSIILPGGPAQFLDGTAYSYSAADGSSATSILFSHCHFTTNGYQTTRPLTFRDYPGTISIDTCSFTNIHPDLTDAGAVFVYADEQKGGTRFTSNSSTFKSCSAEYYRGAMFLSVADDALINSTTFEDCSTTDEWMSDGGSLYLFGIFYGGVRGKLFTVVGCVIAGSKTAERGAGLYMGGQMNLLVESTNSSDARPNTQEAPSILYVPPEEPEKPEPEDPTDPEDPKKAKMEAVKKLLSWLIPLVSCLLIALLVAIIILVLRRRRQQKNAEPAQKEMEAQDQVEFEEKMEVLADDQTKDILHTDGRTHSAFDSSSALPSTLNPLSQAEKSVSVSKGDLVEVMACSGAFEVSVVGTYTTLYSVLHNEKRDIPKRALGMQVVNGLKAVLANRHASDVVTLLSSHWILMDTAGNVQLKLQMNAAEAEQEVAHTKQQASSEANGTVQNLPKNVEQAGIDGIRWRAPEVVAGGGSAVDGHKASVFSLGLVLWEIETGLVPFGELDAVNAQRQSATGIGPKMESLQNEEFIALILQCVSANPEQRPSLSEIGEFLSSHPEEPNMPSHNEMKDQA
ncbi:hypothetical protein BLNAU_7701 [Blattamonas nauphoetae]|uniref:Protein kinase domain-containing protein n=1 Tax=Blattamonas nauphoetae TaxID=2049346 RepID=A0ABQ9Y0S7_9EUKA|nr:hypothetical protein BLNAU_7701 [Blattamonas nauphoetae]